MKREKILVSSCLIGESVRYNGSDKQLNHIYLKEWQMQGRIIHVCPEFSAGMGVPREPCEIAGNKDGEAVLSGLAQVVTLSGRDVTALFIQGAFNTLKIAQQHECHYALLTENSPSCATHYIYDGSFTGNKQPGQGITAALLRKQGINVFSENQLLELYQLIG